MDVSQQEQAEISKTPLPDKGWLRRLVRVLQKIGETFDTRVPQIPLEKIDEKTVAQTIDRHLGNPLQKRFGEGKWVNPFSAKTVMANMGYSVPLKPGDREKFQKARGRVDSALWRLAQEGVLEIQILEEPDKSGERKHYKVVNPKLLLEISKERL